MRVGNAVHRSFCISFNDNLDEPVESGGVHARLGGNHLAEDFDTSSSAGQMIFHVLGVLAEFERTRIRERTLEGLQAARERGRVGGRPPKLNERQCGLVRRMRREGDSLREIARTFNVSVGTVTRALKQLPPNAAGGSGPPGRSTPA